MDNTKLIERKKYLDKLISFKDKKIIKVITGIRRCGKSTLFKLYQNYLLNNGVNQEQIQNINLEDLNNEPLTNYLNLHNHIQSRLIPDKMNYIFLDEIQNVPDFQKTADSLFLKDNVDLYLTGSNSHILSGKWATLLSGRYVTISMLPLSFKEYISTTENSVDLILKYQNYIEYSSFPFVLQLNKNKEQIKEYLRGIYNTVILKDIVENKKITDINRLELLIRFLADNIGNITTAKKISDIMTSDGVKIYPLTIESYISAFIDSFIIYKVSRYDIKGKQYLKTMDKYYLVDIGLRYFLLGNKKADRGHILENVVYLELLRRDYKVYIGKINDKEVDFVCEGNNGIEYYQVSDSVKDEKTLQRELTPLLSIKDHNPKYLLTIDFETIVSHNGIKQINVFEWLLE